MKDYEDWLEKKIEQCSENEDLYRERWAFIQALKKYRELVQPTALGSVCDGCGSKFNAMDISVGVCYCCQKEIKQTDL